jgi:hypothetical protein
MFALSKVADLSYLVGGGRRYDIQHNDTEHNDTHHKGLICDTQYKRQSA